MPTASVVICAYTAERWGQLVAAVRSVQAQTAVPQQVVVVVDHNESLLGRARRELPGVTTVPNREARGLSGARNSGVAVATGEVVAFLDDDAVAEPEWLERLLARYGDPAVLGVGGSIDPDWVDGRPAGFPAEFQWVVGCSYRGLPTTAAPVRNLVGANMSVRRDVLQRAGGFRSGIGRVGRLPVGCEETELCIRARNLFPAGEFVFEPAARVAHVVPASRTSWRYFRARCYGEGISKARVSSAAGPRDALSSERTYTLRTLPAGLVRSLAEGVRGDRSGLQRAAAIAGGLMLTTAGYLVGTVREARA